MTFPMQSKVNDADWQQQFSDRGLRSANDSREDLVGMLLYASGGQLTKAAADKMAHDYLMKWQLLVQQPVTPDQPIILYVGMPVS